MSEDMSSSSSKKIIVDSFQDQFEFLLAFSSSHKTNDTGGPSPLSNPVGFSTSMTAAKLLSKTLY